MMIPRCSYSQVIQCLSRNIFQKSSQNFFSKSLWSEKLLLIQKHIHVVCIQIIVHRRQSWATLRSQINLTQELKIQRRKFFKIVFTKTILQEILQLEWEHSQVVFLKFANEITSRGRKRPQHMLGCLQKKTSRKYLRVFFSKTILPEEFKRMKASQVNVCQV